MPKYKVQEFFTFKSCSPSSLQQDNLIQFSYHSPNGVHDKMPLVYVIEKRRDRIFGLNLHYDSNQLVSLVDDTNDRIDVFLEKEWYKKYPKKKQELKKQRAYFYRDLVEPKDLKEITKRVKKQDLEQFYLQPQNDDIFRCYLLKRMNSVQRCIYKVIQ